MIKLVLAIAALVPACCTVDGFPDGTYLAGGTATIELTGTQLAVTGFDAPDVVYGSGMVELRYLFGDGTGETWAELDCIGVPWSTIEHASAPSPLDSACVKPPQITVETAACHTTASLATGTLTVISNVDDKHDGTVTFQLDIPSVDVAAIDSCHGPRTLAVSATALAGVMRFAPTSCTSSPGLNPVI